MIACDNGRLIVIIADYIDTRVNTISERKHPWSSIKLHTALFMLGSTPTFIDLTHDV